MSMLSQIAERLVPKGRADEPAIHVFADVAQAGAKVAELKKLRDAAKVRLKTVRRRLYDRVEVENGITAEAEAMLEGRRRELLPNLQEAERDVAVAEKAFGMARTAYGDLREARLREVCAHLAPAHRKVVREMARLLARVSELTRLERDMHEALRFAGAPLNPLPYLGFAPCVTSNDPCNSPYLTWLQALRACGILDPGEEPAAIPAADQIDPKGLSVPAAIRMVAGNAREPQASKRGGAAR